MGIYFTGRICLTLIDTIYDIAPALCSVMYGIMTEELVIREIRIDEAAGRGDSDSRMTSFEVIMPLKLRSTIISPVFDL